MSNNPSKRAALPRRNKAGKKPMTRHRAHRLDQQEEAARRTGKRVTVRDLPLRAYPQHSPKGPRLKGTSVIPRNPGKGPASVAEVLRASQLSRNRNNALKSSHKKIKNPK